jgi:hypothetical protein
MWKALMRLIGKGVGAALRNPEAIEGAITIWQKRQQKGKPSAKEPVPEVPAQPVPPPLPYVPCGAPGPDGLYCTLLAGHLGAHASRAVSQGQSYERYW